MSAEKSATPAARSSQAQPGAAVASPTPSDGTTGRNLAVGLGLSLLVILAAVLGGFWMVHRRTRGRLDQRIKEIRSRATDVMDRLDALKERLKLLPASDPDFKTPMAGETAALYASIQEAVGKLWDRWLQVMDSLDRAQKLALGVTSPFKRKALHDAEALLEQKGAFEEIDAGPQACAADMDRLNQAHESARAELETVDSVKPKVDAQVEAIRKLGLPIAPYQEEMAAIAARDRQGRRAHPRRPDRRPLDARASAPEARPSSPARSGSAGCSRTPRSSASCSRALKRQVAEHRAKGLRLDEAGRQSGRVARARRIAPTRGPSRPSAPAIPTRRRRSSRRPRRCSSEPGAPSSRSEAPGLLPSRAPGATSGRPNASGRPCRRRRPIQRLEREFAQGSWEGVARTWTRSTACWPHSTGWPRTPPPSRPTTPSDTWPARAAPPARPAAAGRAAVDVGDRRHV